MFEGGRVIKKAILIDRAEEPAGYSGILSMVIATCG
jgi:hypothetical protein